MAIYLHGPGFVMDNAIVVTILEAVVASAVRVDRLEFAGSAFRNYLPTIASNFLNIKELFCIIGSCVWRSGMVY